MRALLALAAALCALSFQGIAPAQSTANGFGDWAAVVVAGDWRAGSGKPTPAFENARRDVESTLLKSGFTRGNLRTLGLAEGEGEGSVTTTANLAAALQATTARGQGGCLVYVTSHGTPAGVVFGREGLLRPGVLGRMLDNACGRRPTVVFVSACYSGVFVPALAAPNRLVLTAARPDRTSFGCGEDDRYPFFDACVLSAWPQAADLLALAPAVRRCVDARERELKLQPPSEPQVYVGGHARALLPLLPLPGGKRPAA